MNTMRLRRGKRNETKKKEMFEGEVSTYIASLSTQKSKQEEKMVLEDDRIG